MGTFVLLSELSEDIQSTVHVIKVNTVYHPAVGAAAPTLLPLVRARGLHHTVLILNPNQLLHTGTISMCRPSIPAVPNCGLVPEPVVIMIPLLPYLSFPLRDRDSNSLGNQRQGQ